MSFFIKNKNKSTLDNRRKDRTDALAGSDYNNEDTGKTRGLVLDLFHIPTNSSVSFKAFLTTYSDQYNSSWESTEVFGRMDPIQTFKNTKRVISLGWDVVASSIEEAVINLDKCQRLFSMLYPVYETHDPKVPGSTTMVASPLFKLKFVNLIQNVGLGSDKLAAQQEIKAFDKQLETSVSKLIGLEEELEAQQEIYKKAEDAIRAQANSDPVGAFNSEAFRDRQEAEAKIKDINEKIYKTNTKADVVVEKRQEQQDILNFKSIGNSKASIDGLVGTVSGFTYEPDIEVGFFSDGTGGELYPQTIKLACEYTVLHTHELGWDKATKQKREGAFPYRSNTKR